MEGMNKKTLSGCLMILMFGMVVFIGLFLYFALSGSGRETAEKLTQITVIPAPTLTPTVHATAEPIQLDVKYVSEGGLSVGALIEISGTENTGLSVRPNPGTGGVLNFVAYDGERFKIIDGPEAKNDYVWWKIQSVSDADRSGWAVEDFMKGLQ